MFYLTELKNLLPAEGRVLKPKRESMIKFVSWPYIFEQLLFKNGFAVGIAGFVQYGVYESFYFSQE